MLVYSKTINAFINRIQTRFREILTLEVGLIVRRTRFEWGNKLIPFHIVAFEDPKKLGHFDYRYYQIGLNKNLMYKAKPEVLDNILRHEITHLLTFLTYDHQVISHGNEFRDISKRYGWGPEVYSAYSNLESDNQNAQEHVEFDKIKSKIQKLLNLASSSNQFEAEAATAKANEILLKHNLSFIDTEEEVCVKKVLQQRRMDTKIGAIYDLMKYFIVQPVFNKGESSLSLDIVGSRLNVEMADYVAKFLFSEFDFFWKKAQKENPKLRGIRSKNSYFIGLAKGFEQKLKQSEKNQSNINSTDLVLIQDKLTIQLQLVYPKLSKASPSKAGLCKSSINQGIKDGAGLNIRPGVKQNKLVKLLT